MIETFIIKGYRTISEGKVPDYQTNIGYKEYEIARRELDEFPTDEDMDTFRQEFNPTRCEIVKNYR